MTQQERIEQAAKKIADEETEHGGKWVSRDEVYYSCLEMAKLLLTHQWISVDERLPEKDENGSDTSIYVLVTDNSNPFGYIWKAYYDFTIKDWYDAMSCENLNKHNITHWMPIPEIGG